MDISKKWDTVADQFNTYKDDVWYGAQDNIKSVWPIFLKYIKEALPSPSGLNALDFGCGTGMFCRELDNLGFKTSGIDASEEMVKIGKSHLDQNIKLLAGGADTAKKLSQTDGKFNLITAIMVLQFLEEGSIKELVEALAPEGYIIFANHNPAHLDARGVKDCFTLGEAKMEIPIFKRTAEVYDKIFLDFGFKKILEENAESVPEIKKQYKINSPLEVRKYLILGYKKI